MSEEEIIDEIKYNILNDPFIVFSQDASFESTQIKATAIQGLLELYQEEKEKNKELSEKVTQNICNRVETEVLEEYRLKVQNSISKDKIREKIENLEGYIQENSDEQGYWGSEHQEDIYAKIEILEELLGE